MMTTNPAGSQPIKGSDLHVPQHVREAVLAVFSYSMIPDVGRVPQFHRCTRSEDHTCASGSDGLGLFAVLAASTATGSAEALVDLLVADPLFWQQCRLAYQRATGLGLPSTPPTAAALSGLAMCIVSRGIAALHQMSSTFSLTAFAHALELGYVSGVAAETRARPVMQARRTGSALSQNPAGGGHSRSEFPGRLACLIPGVLRLSRNTSRVSLSYAGDRRLRSAAGHAAACSDVIMPLTALDMETSSGRLILMLEWCENPWAESGDDGSSLLASLNDCEIDTVVLRDMGGATLTSETPTEWVQATADASPRLLSEVRPVQRVKLTHALSQAEAFWLRVGRTVPKMAAALIEGPATDGTTRLLQAYLLVMLSALSQNASDSARARGHAQVQSA